MTISINQQVDYLWKKLGFKVAKTDVSSIKDATNERITSAPFLPGDKIWAQADLIPGIIPAVTGGAVQVFTLASSLICTMDITAQLNRTWLTNLTDWIPPEYGSTYQLQVFLAPTGNANPASWQQLYAAGSNNDDEWYFDYEAGVLNFIGNNLPNHSWTNKEIRICGARYTGLKGLGVFVSASIGNITINGDTISSIGNIILDPAGNISVSGSTITNLQYSTVPTDAATVQYVIDEIMALHPNTLFQGDSIVRLSDPTGNAGILTFTIDGNLVATFTNTASTLGNITVTNNEISSTGDLVFRTSGNSIITTNATTAWQVPAGSVFDRPTVPLPGYIRFNTTSNGLEVWNGTDWAGAQSAIGSQIITGDGVNNSFLLDQETHATNILVMIHGVTQRPNESYTVVGLNIIFNEPPADGEVVEIRFISLSVTPDTTEMLIDTDPLIIGTSPFIIDAFSAGTSRSVKYTISITTADNEGQMADLLLTHNWYAGRVGASTTKMFMANTDMTGGSTTITYDSYITAGMCYLTATSSTAGSKFKLQKTYFTT